MGRKIEQIIMGTVLTLGSLTFGCETSNQYSSSGTYNSQTCSDREKQDYVTTYSGRGENSNTIDQASSCSSEGGTYSCKMQTSYYGRGEMEKNECVCSCNNSSGRSSSEPKDGPDKSGM